jgi:hypothetical protein
MATAMICGMLMEVWLSAMVDVADIPLVGRNGLYLQSIRAVARYSLDVCWHSPFGNLAVVQGGSASRSLVR